MHNMGPVATWRRAYNATCRQMCRAHARTITKGVFVFGGACKHRKCVFGQLLDVAAWHEMRLSKAEDSTYVTRGVFEALELVRRRRSTHIRLPCIRLSEHQCLGSIYIYTYIYIYLSLSLSLSLSSMCERIRYHSKHAQTIISSMMERFQ